MKILYEYIPLLNDSGNTSMQGKPTCLTRMKHAACVAPLQKKTELCLTFSAVAKVVVHIMKKFFSSTWKLFTGIGCTQMCTVTNEARGDLRRIVVQ